MKKLISPKKGDVDPDSIPKASLLGLPTEILDQIIQHCEIYTETSASKPHLKYKFVPDWTWDGIPESIMGPEIAPLAQTCRTLRRLCFNAMFQGAKLSLYHDDAKTTAEFFASLSMTDLNAVRIINLRYHWGPLLPIDYVSFRHVCAIFSTMESLQELHILMPLCAELPEDRHAEREWNQGGTNRTIEEKERVWWNTRRRPWIRDLLMIRLRGVGEGEGQGKISVSSKTFYCTEDGIDEWINRVLAEDWESRKARLERMEEVE